MGSLLSENGLGFGEALFLEIVGNLHPGKLVAIYRSAILEPTKPSWPFLPMYTILRSTSRLTCSRSNVSGGGSAPRQGDVVVEEWAHVCVVREVLMETGKRRGRGSSTKMEDKRTGHRGAIQRVGECRLVA